MKIKFSNNGYKVKPTGAEFGKIANELKSKVTEEINAAYFVDKVSKGYSFLVADYGDKLGTMATEDIKSIEYLILDIDSKEAVININAMSDLIYHKVWANPIVTYPTFSDSGDNTKFRLIYKLEREVTVAEHQLITQALLQDHKIGKYLDRQSLNANRVFCGTDKKVNFNKLALLGNQSINELIEEGKEHSYINTPNDNITALNKLLEGKNKGVKFNDELYNNLYIKSEFKNELTDYIKAKINIYDFIIATFGGSFKKTSTGFTGCCPIHKGDNKTAFVIYAATNTYRCFTGCNTSGNVLSIAYQYYGTNDFSEMVFKLEEDNIITINECFIGTRGVK